MPLDKVLSASIANAAVNASAISNTANLVIGALNTGNTVITGTAVIANSTSNVVFVTANGNIGVNNSTPNLDIVIQKNNNSKTGLRIYNSNTGTSTHTGIEFGNDLSNNRSGIASFNSTWSNSGLYYSDSMYVYNNSTTGGIYLHSENGAPIVLGVSSYSLLSVNTSGVAITGNSSIGGLTITSTTAASSGSVLKINKANTTTQAYISVNTDEVYMGAGASNSNYGIIGSKANVAIQVGYNDRVLLNNSGPGMVLKGKYCVDFSTGITNYTTVNPSHSVLLQGSPNDRDCWIYLDPADTVSNWGIYHRNVDTTVGSVPGNSIAFIGGGTSGSKGYICLVDGTWGIGNNNVVVSSSGIPNGAGGSASDFLWFRAWQSTMQRTSYDRSWDNYPSITVQNTTDVGPQGEFRIHGAGGVNGGDFSVVTRCDGGYATGSDSRRKTNIESITNALQTVIQLNGKKFNITNRNGELDPMRGNKKQLGLIAQDCLNIIPEAVTFYADADEPNENGWASAYSIDYQSLTPLLIEAIKELNAELASANARIEQLESR